jgi:hypothetical protein
MVHVPAVCGGDGFTGGLPAVLPDLSAFSKFVIPLICH